MRRRPLLLRPFRDLPLAWKLMVPYLLLVVLVGVTGGVVVVHSLSVRVQNALDDQLTRRLLDARSSLKDRELYLVESADYAANIQGVGDAVRGGDRTTTTRLLSSVLALEGDVTVLAATDRRGRGVGELVRDGAGGSPGRGSGADWDREPLVRQALASGRSTAGVVRLASGPVLAVATPVCDGTEGCRPLGVALAGLPVRAALAQAQRAGTGLAAYDVGRTPLAETGPRGAAPPSRTGDQLVRLRADGPDGERETLYGPLELQGTSLGTLAVTLPTDGAFAAVRGTAYRLAGLLLLAMLGVVAIGVLLSRRILGQLREAVAVNRRLGSGDLDARVPVTSDDELGELGAGLNQMAEQLQAAVTTLESRADQSAEEVQRLLRQRTDFFAGLSHEFRTPLAVIRAQAGHLLEQPRRRPAAEEVSLGVVRDAAAQALTLVDEVLELARSDAGRVEVVLADVRVAELVGRLRPTMGGAGHRRRAVARGRGRTGPARPAVRERRLGQVLLNLVDNAVKYTPDGGAVRVTVQRDDDDVVLAVADTGVGISEDDLGRLFQPYSRAARSRPQHGQASTGLGLALTRQLVEALGGSVEAQSRPGTGTVMTVRLPVRRDPVPAQPDGRAPLPQAV